MNETGKSLGSRRTSEKSRGHSVSGSITLCSRATKGLDRDDFYIYIFLHLGKCNIELQVIGFDPSVTRFGAGGGKTLFLSVEK